MSAVRGSGVWNAVAVQEAWGEDMGAARLPSYSCAGQQVQMASFSGYKLLGVNAYSKQREWAARLAFHGNFFALRGGNIQHFIQGFDIFLCKILCVVVKEISVIGRQRQPASTAYGTAWLWKKPGGTAMAPQNCLPRKETKTECSVLCYGSSMYFRLPYGAVIPSTMASNNS